MKDCYQENSRVLVRICSYTNRMPKVLRCPVVFALLSSDMLTKGILDGIMSVEIAMEQLS